ncbi:ACT domain-containing protein [Psychromonas ingrahamii]|uniref:ACT domain-containing protein n=1 Tax=Psychromonas ingrahamii TaxID=357794 RepID=UPI001E4AADD1|nr:ACT domain-containing protein [Psychromonas ingrahamii]
MVGESNLIKLLASMEAVRQDEEYVFCTIEGAQYGDYAEISPLASILNSKV